MCFLRQWLVTGPVLYASSGAKEGVNKSSGAKEGVNKSSCAKEGVHKWLHRTQIMGPYMTEKERIGMSKHRI